MSDDMCHLLAFMKNRKQADPLISFLVSIEHAIDVFHFKNHVTPSCKQNLHPKQKWCAGINMEACEQQNRFLKKFKGSMRYMNEARFPWFFLFVVDKQNEVLSAKCSAPPSVVP
jgi:hypothetical protein